MRSLWLILLLCGSSFAQYGGDKSELIPASGGATPGLVNFRGMPSSEGNATGAKTNNTCATNAVCGFYVDPTSGANTGVVFYTYAHASSIPPTVTDDKSDTYTSCGTEALSGTFYLGCAYNLSLTAGARAVTVTWSASVTQASIAATQWYNTTAIDGYNHNNGSSATTLSSGSITPSVSGDLFIEMACAAATTNVDRFSPGSQSNISWFTDLADQRDGCSAQHGVYSSTSALIPQLTIATGVNYAAIGLALKAGSHGTAPTPPYVAHIYTVSSATSIPPGIISYQVPATGNLVAGTETAYQIYPAGITDSTNGAWTECAGRPQVFASTTNYASSSWYVANPTPDLLNLTMTMAELSGSGDIGPFYFVDMVGMSSTPNCSRNAVLQNAQTAAATLTVHPSFVPAASDAIELFTTSMDFNTVIGINTPSGGLFDAHTYGNMPLSGPEPMDENNGLGHIHVASNVSNQLIWNVSASGTAVQFALTEPVAFPTSGATNYATVVNSATTSLGSTGTTVSVNTLTGGTYTSGITATGTTGQTCVLSGFNDGGFGAVATVALTGTNTIAGGTSLSVLQAGDQFTAAPTSAATGNGSATCSGTATVSTTVGYKPKASGDYLIGIECGITSGAQTAITDGVNTWTSILNDGTTSRNGFYCSTWQAASIAATTITITGHVASTSFRTIHVFEVSHVTHGYDSSANNIVAKSSTTGGVLTGTAVTPSNSAGELFVEFVMCSNNCNTRDNNLPSNGNLAPWSIVTFDAGGNVGGYLPVQGTSTVSAGAVDISGSASETAAMAIVGIY